MTEQVFRVTTLCDLNTQMWKAKQAKLKHSIKRIRILDCWEAYIYLGAGKQLFYRAFLLKKDAEGYYKQLTLAGLPQ